MVGGKCDGVLQVQGRFDHGGDEAGRNVPFDVAVEEPDAWVVGAEAEDNVAVGGRHEGISLHRNSWKCLVACPITCVLLGARNSLEGVAVEMERVAAFVVVVEDDFDHVVLLEDEGVGIGAVDNGVGGEGAGGEGGVEGGDFWAGVGMVVEEGVVDAVGEVIHFDVEVEGVVDFIHKGLGVFGDESEVIKGSEGV